VSALTGQRALKTLDYVKKIYAEARRRIQTSELNEFLQDIVKRKHPPARRGKHIRLYYGTQTEIGPPTFVFFSNHPQLIDKSYIGYISNQIRRQFGFEGVPFRVKFRKK
jgi:GTP-binding protein